MVSRATWVQLFLFLHVFGAIAAVGPTLTYGMWLVRAEKAGLQERAFTLRTVSWVDSHLATPAFIVQAGTGTALLLLLRLRFIHTAWLVVGVAVYFVMSVFAVTVYAPIVKKQVDLGEQAATNAGDPDLEARYRAAATRARNLGLVAVVLTLAILYFMIVKPALWSAG